MSNTQTKGLFWGVVMAQVVVVLLLIVFRMTILSGGTEVLLHIAPLDPRDPLRGDYVTFRYDISQIDSYFVPDGIRDNDTIFVPLEKHNEYLVVAGPVSKTRAEAQDVSNIILKGTVGNIFSSGEVSLAGDLMTN